MKGWAVMVGRGFGAVASSQFCDSRILADLLLMLQHAQVIICGTDGYTLLEWLVAITPQGDAWCSG